MINTTSDDYAQYLKVNVEQKIAPLNESIDAMLIRLEECETMLTLVQQERCNAVGITGALTEAMDYRGFLSKLTTRIDAVENVISHLSKNLEYLELKMTESEEQSGIVDTTTKLKSFIYPLFKMRQPQEKQTTNTMENINEFSTSEYFSGDSIQESTKEV